MRHVASRPSSRVLPAAALALVSSTASAADVFTGFDVTFTKAAFADFTLPENQDRMTDNVWITRADVQGIFNIAQEPSFDGSGASSPSPIGTRWAFGSAADWETLTFGTWGDAHQGSPPSLVGQDMVLHLVDDDIYLDIRFTAWGVGGGSGGSFAYVRSALATPPCNPADLAEPFGILDLADLQAFITGFLGNDPSADIAPPFGILDLSDVQAFVGAFIGGCP